MSSITVLIIAAGYFSLRLLFSKVIGGDSDNDAFFRGNRKSPWWAVAFGMIGASISGVTFVSVPGMVGTMQMTYLQTCFGFLVGYILVAMVLLPLYYKMNLTSIYAYLNERFGTTSHRTGAFFFFLSKLIGASIRLYLVCMILQQYLLDSLSISFPITTFILLLLIWLYTRKNGIKTIVWSDCLQTLVLLAALMLIVLQLCNKMNLDILSCIQNIKESPHSRIFVFDDVSDKQYFWKQFISGIFIVVVMTGLDQDMMQKNLTCKTLRQSQLNMCVNGLMYIPINFLFLCLGVLLYQFIAQNGINPPVLSDELLPTLCASGTLGELTMLFFTLGLVAAAFSSADSALTSLTTCMCVDILRKPESVRLRQFVHPCIAACFFLFILLVRALNNTSVIDAVYVVCGFTYGPLLGLFAFGLFTKYKPRESWVPYICVISPVLCFVLDKVVPHYFHYHFGYELLMLNGFLSFLGLLVSSAKFRANNACSDCDV